MGDTRVQRARHWVAPIRGFITKYMNQGIQKSEFRKALNCLNAGERMNIERPTSNFQFEKMKQQNYSVKEQVFNDGIISCND
jgi:hypothetical protein